MGTKAFVTVPDLFDSDGNLHCLMWPLSSCDENIYCVSM